MRSRHETCHFSAGIQEYHAELHGEHGSTEGRPRGDRPVRDRLQGLGRAAGGLLAQGQQRVHRVRRVRQPAPLRLDRAGVHHAAERRARGRPTRGHQGGLQPELGRAARLRHPQGRAGARRARREGRRRRRRTEELGGDPAGDRHALEEGGEQEDRALLMSAALLGDPFPQPTLCARSTPVAVCLL
jgi:hypothetical protein